MFYDVYKKLCDENGEKPYQLPLKLGAKSNSIVAQWKNGSLPRPDMLQKIADHFHVSVGYLVGGETDIKNPAPTGGDGLNEEFMKLFQALSPEEQVREIAYLRERVAGKDM